MPNYGVTTADGGLFTSKAAFRRAVEAGEPIKVVVTSAFENVFPPKQLHDLLPSDVIVGPDPYTKRDWYGNVKITKTGELRVV